MIAILNDAPEAVAAAAMQVHRADMALIGMATVVEARSRAQACRLALPRMTAVSDDIVSRNPRAFD
jgi:hypothetical protein